MRLNKFLIIAVASLGLMACDSELKQPVEFLVEVEPAAGVIFTDSFYTAPVGTSLTFNFSGEPDFISFSYSRFIKTRPELSFSSRAAWGTHVANSLSVYVSEDFKGLAMNNFIADSTSIATHTWKNITSQANLPISANDTRTANIPLDDYSGKNLVIAFRYKPDFMADWQPTWVISNLNIANKLITDGSVASTYLAATLGFSPFDMLNRTTAYRDTLLSGNWSTKIPAELTINRTAMNNPLNHDWLISKPILVPAGITEESAVTGVKTMANRVESYTHTFTLPGEYILKFKAGNYNYLYSDSLVNSIRLIVTN